MNAVVKDYSPRASSSVQASLNYTLNTGVRPVNYTFDPPPGVPRNSGEIDARTVTIRDARRERGLWLDASGFELVSHRGSLREFRQFQDPAAIRAIDYPEVPRGACNVASPSSIIGDP
jgi:hypothetical protein